MLGFNFGGIMRIQLFCLMFLFGLMISSSVYAGNGYFGVRGGISDLRETDVVDKYKSAGFVSAYIGGQSSAFRAEVEYTALSKVKFESLQTDSQFQRLMANGYVDLHVSRYVRPYFGAGIGSAFYSVHDKKSQNKSSGANFAWNATAGAGVKLTKNVTFDTGYRYVDMGDVSVGNQNLHFNTQEVYAGLRFSF